MQPMPALPVFCIFCTNLSPRFLCTSYLFNNSFIAFSGNYWYNATNRKACSTFSFSNLSLFIGKPGIVWSTIPGFSQGITKAANRENEWVLLVFAVFLPYDALPQNPQTAKTKKEGKTPSFCIFLISSLLRGFRSSSWGVRRWGKARALLCQRLSDRSCGTPKSARLPS